MRPKTTLLGVLLLAPICSWGQGKVSLKFDSTSPKVVFTSSGWPAGLPANPTITKDKSLDFPLGALDPSDYLVVWDRDSNNAAIRLVKDIASPWTVGKADYRYVGLVKMRIEHDGKAVAAAQVSLADKNHDRSRLIDPSSNGETTFFGLTPGDFKVKVQYLTAGKDVSQQQGFEVAIDRDRPEPTFVVSIPDDVETVGPSPTEARTKPSEGTTSGAAASAERPAANSVGSFLVYVLSLVAAALVIVAGLLYLKKNRAAVAAQLKNLGVAMPEPPDAPPGAQAPAPAPAKPEPLQKIILEDAAPTPIAPPAPSLSTAPAAGPRIVRDNGDSFTLAEGENLVGRDASLAIALPSESSVSRRHAAFVVDGASVTLKDLGSTNGSYVNSVKLEEERSLSAGDSLQFGQVRFRFER